LTKIFIVLSTGPHNLFFAPFSLLVRTKRFIVDPAPYRTHRRNYRDFATTQEADNGISTGGFGTNNVWYHVKLLQFKKDADIIAAIKEHLGFHI
jgi:hypothetical protein